MRLDGISAALLGGWTQSSCTKELIVTVGDRDLHVKWKQNCQAIVVLDSMQTKVFLKIVKARISNICAIQEAKSDVVSRLVRLENVAYGGGGRTQTGKSAT